MRLFSCFLMSLLLTLLCVLGCDSNSPTLDDDCGDTSGTAWQAIGPEGVQVRNLRLFDCRLYATTVQGLFRLDLRQPETGWQNLGLGSTLASNARGTVDVIEHPHQQNWLLATIDLNIRQDTHTVYRSFDDGLTWMPSAHSLTYEDAGEIRYRAVKWFSLLPSRVLLDGVYASEDFGETWQRIDEDLTGYGGHSVIERHPMNPELIWSGGATFALTPLLGYSINGGRVWNDAHNIGELASLQAVHSIALVSENEEVVYVGLSPLLAKSNNRGNSWMALETGLDSATFESLLVDSRNAEHVWATAYISPTDSPELIETWNAGESWAAVPTPFEAGVRVQDLLLDAEAEVLYLGTSVGVYRYNLNTTQNTQANRP